MFLDEQALLSDVTRRFAPVAVVLYGSAARLDLTPASDIDLVCFVERDERYPELGTWRGYLLDVWIYPVSDAEDDAQFLRLHDGRVLLDRDGLAAGLLARVNARIAIPPPPLDAKQALHLRAWLWKMFLRGEQGDTEGNHRLHWLLHELPQVWCELTQRHYLGFTSAMRTLRTENAEAHAALEKALRPAASRKDVEAAVLAVAGPTFHTSAAGAAN